MTDIRFDIIARDRASKSFRDVGHAADSTSSKFAKFAMLGRRAALGFAAVGAAAGVFAYKVGSDYVGSLNKIQALTGANDKTMKAAAKTLEANSGLYAKMGQTTGDAAAGVVELTKAGLSLHDSLKAVNATMVLAKAGELSVADASTLVANSLNTFGLKANKAGKIANQLANAANISSANVSDLAESFKYVSPVAASAGVSMGQVNAILAELSNSGIKASQAGTALRTFLLNLEAPGSAAAKTLTDLNVQVFDAAGNMKPLPVVIDTLSKALDGLPASEKAADLKAIFGKVGIAGATTILKEGSKGLADYTAGVNRAGAASRLAEANSKGLAGTFAMFKAQVISSTQSLYRQWSPALNEAILRTVALAGSLKDQLLPVARSFGQWISENVPKVQELGRQIAHNLQPALVNVEKEFKKSKPQIMAFANAIGAAIPKISQLTKDLTLQTSKLNGKSSPAWVRFAGVIGREVVRQMAGWIQTAGQLADSLDAMVRQVSFAARMLQRLADAFGTAGKKAAAFASSIGSRIQSAVGSLGHVLFNAGASVIQGLIDGIESKIPSMTSVLHHVTSLIPLHKGPPSKDRTLLRGAGRSIMDGLIAGIADRTLTLEKALSRVTSIIGKVKDKISNLKSARAGFQGTFAADSLFGQDFSQTTTDAAGNDVTTPGTIGDVLAFQTQQRDKANALNADIKRVTKLGLSKSLIKQLESQGASGAATLHALAQGSRDQIRQLNALDKQTSASLASAGMRAGNYVRGGSVSADLRNAKKTEHVLELLEHHLKDLAHSEKKGETIVVQIDSEAIIRAVKRRNSRKGVKSAGL